MKKEVEEHIRRWEELSCFLTVKITIEKMVALLKMMYRVYKLPIKITVSFFSFAEIREKLNHTSMQKILNDQSNPRKGDNKYHII